MALLKAQTKPCSRDSPYTAVLLPVLLIGLSFDHATSNFKQRFASCARAHVCVYLSSFPSALQAGTQRDRRPFDDHLPPSLPSVASSLLAPPGGGHRRHFFTVRLREARAVRRCTRPHTQQCPYSSPDVREVWPSSRASRARSWLRPSDVVQLCLYGGTTNSREVLSKKCPESPRGALRDKVALDLCFGRTRLARTPSTSSFPRDFVLASFVVPMAA